MTYKWIGAILIIAGCGGCGFSLVSKHRKEEKYLRELIDVLHYIANELQYHLTPLPALCRQASRISSGILRNILLDLARELDWQSLPDAGSCMAASLKKNREVPVCLRRLLVQLGHTLGRFDLAGQLQGLQRVQASCQETLNKYITDKDSRLRSYQTLGLCAGVALVILLV